jgi:hypothetical protein
MKFEGGALETRGGVWCPLSLLSAAIAVAACGSATVDPTRAPATKPKPDAAPSAPADPGLGFTLPDAAAMEAGGAVMPPAKQCAEDVQQAKLMPVDLLLLVDASGSMGFKAGERTRWELARAAMGAFLGDMRSAGLGVGLQMFPHHVRTCMNDGTCFLPSPGGCKQLSACLAPNAPVSSGFACGGPSDDDCPSGTVCTPLGKCSMTGGDCVGMGQPCPTGVANDVCGARPRQCRLGPGARGNCDERGYATPVVPIADLPGAAQRLTGALDTRLPLGATPLGSAIKGSLTHLTARLAANQGRRVALVIVSDGVPEGCDNGDIVEDLTAARMATPSVSTYVIGVFGDDAPPEARAAMNEYAMAGGTGNAFIVSPNAQLSEAFLGALNQIRGAVLPCEITIPKPSSGQIDFGLVNVRVSGTAGPNDLLYVERRERCDPMKGGWYYDVDPKAGTPGRVHLCEAVCAGLKSDPKAQVEVRFGCQSRIVD